MRETPNCPLCGKTLNRVVQGPNGMLNSDQFDSVKAGDWFCRSCKGDEATGTDFKYFWESELKPTPISKRRVVFEFDERSTCTIQQLMEETGTTQDDYICVPVIKDGNQTEILIPKKLK